MLFSIILNACTSCKYDGIFDETTSTCTCTGTGGRTAASCCAKCANPAKDAQTDCGTCLDQYANFTLNCYQCQENTVLWNQSSCRPIAIVEEGRTLSYVLGSIYIAAAVVISVWLIIKKIKENKALA